MVVIIKKRKNVNHAGFDDAKKNLFDNGYHHKKGGQCESCFDDVKKNLLNNNCHYK